VAGGLQIGERFENALIFAVQAGLIAVEQREGTVGAD